MKLDLAEATNHNKYQLKVVQERDREIVYLMNFIRSINKEVEKVCIKTESSMKTLQVYVDTTVQKLQFRVS